MAHEPTSPLFTLTLVGPSLDAASLETRQLSLTADGREAFEGVVVWVALLDAGEVVVDGEHPLLGPLPQTVAQDASVWQPLAIAARARRSSLFSLRVEIGALARAEWPLPQPAQGEATADGASSAGHGDPLWCAARAPLSASERGEGEFGLLQPTTASGLPALGSGRCHGPDTLQAGLSPARPRLLRRLDVPTARPRRAADISHLALRGAAWRTAIGEGAVAEIVRLGVAARAEAWLVEALCGTRWLRLEIAATELVGPAFGRAVVRRLEVGSGLRDAAVDELIARHPHRDSIEEMRRGAVVAWVDAHRDDLLERCGGAEAERLDEARAGPRDALALRRAGRVPDRRPGEVATLCTSRVGGERGSRRAVSATG